MTCQYLVFASENARAYLAQCREKEADKHQVMREIWSSLCQGRKWLRSYIEHIYIYISAEESWLPSFDSESRISGKTATHCYLGTAPGLLNMSTLRREDGSTGLLPGVIIDSPGSSVFDLPTQLPGAPQLKRKPIILTEATAPPISKSSPSQLNDSTRFIVISGGTGGNAICSAFGDACYVLPVSDDGGSSSEIIRVLGGPSIGTYRASSSFYLFV